MKTRPLGHTDIQVSEICLGTMTWGEQNDQADGNAQMDYALDHEVTFWDTAEMYSVPPRPETQGSTETIIGNWFAETGRRSEVVLATKISPMGYLREGNTRFNAKHISSAIDGSLKRLQTDYIDLYQLHWPERKTNYFSKLGYTNEMIDQDLSTLTSFLETVEALNAEIKKGRIRAYGLSNETAWGVMGYINAAKQAGLELPVSVQNPYSLLNRTYEIGMSEIAHRENVGLLAYSPLGFGVLSGKYLDGKKDEKARLNLPAFKGYGRYTNEQAVAATKAYAKIAADNNLDMAQMALAYINSRHFVTSNIIGATSMAQLESNIASAKLTLSDDVLEAIEAVHVAHPNPSP